VPFVFRPGETRQFDPAAIRSAIGAKTRAMLLMSPSMPSGGVLDADDWAVVAELCVAHSLLLIVDSAMERLLFGRPQSAAPGRSAGHGGAHNYRWQRLERELRMIGWRVGWTIAPEWLMPDLVAVALANVVVPVGIAQDAAAIALERSQETLPGYVAELQRRRDAVAEALHGLPFGMPAGGWSMLLRVADFGLDGAEMAARLLKQGVGATAMQSWGEVHGRDYIRFVFANEPVDRLRLLGPAVRTALGQ
jgi:aspartate/methionine/tyrosine aminotransferase